MPAAGTKLPLAEANTAPPADQEAVPIWLKVRKDAGASTGAAKPFVPAPGKIVMGPVAVAPIRSGRPSPVTSPTAASRVIDFQPAPSERARPNLPLPRPGYRTSWSPPATRTTTSALPSRSQSPTSSS
jgi:hypothetical protein